MPNSSNLIVSAPLYWGAGSLETSGFVFMPQNVGGDFEISTNPDAIEQIAREKYLMKKPNEDIYVFEDNK